MAESEWDEPAAAWDDDPAVQAYAGAAAGSLTSLATSVGFSLAGARVCDFGCGTGLLTERLAEQCSHIDAIDTSQAMLAVLAAKVERAGWTHVRLLDQLPEAGQRYNLIVCSSVLAFVEDYPGMVRRLVAHLADGGLFVQWDWERDPDGEPFGLTTAEIERALIGAGLHAVSVGTAFEVAMGTETMRPLMGSGRRAAAPTEEAG